MDSDLQDAKETDRLTSNLEAFGQELETRDLADTSTPVIDKNGSTIDLNDSWINDILSEESGGSSHQNDSSMSASWLSYFRRVRSKRRIAPEGENAIFETIDWMEDDTNITSSPVNNTHVQNSGCWMRFYDLSQAWLIVFATGVLVGLVAASTAVATEWLSDVKLGYCKSQFWLNRKFCCSDVTMVDCRTWVFWSQLSAQGNTNGVPSHPFWDAILAYTFYTVAAILMSGISSLIVTLSSFANGSGIAEIKSILSGVAIRGFLGAKTLVVKSTGLAFSVASGLSIGKEGPMVHIACCCGHLFSQVFPKYRNNEVKKREIITAASAAGVAVAFGAPIGGILFSLEEASYYFPPTTMWRTLFCAMIAAVTLQLINPFGAGHLVLYQVTYDRDWHMFELLPFILLGIFGGIFGVVFTRITSKIVQFRKDKLQWYPQYAPWKEVLLVTLVTALICYPSTFLRVDTNELLQNLFNECEKGHFFGLCNRPSYLKISLHLFLACILKIALTILAFGIKVPAGLYIPSMGVGALFGRSLGMIVQVIQEKYPHYALFGSCGGSSCITPGLYALVGAASALTGVTKMTVSVVIIMFEVTGALKYTFPVMIAVMVSKWTSDAFQQQGIYEVMIKINKIPFLGGRLKFKEMEVAHLIAMKASDGPVRVIINDQTTFDEIKCLQETQYRGFPVIDQQKKVIGYIKRTDLVQLPDGIVTMKELQRTTMNVSPLIVGETMQIQMLYELFRRMGVAYVLVVENNQFIQIITRYDLLRHCLQP